MFENWFNTEIHILPRWEYFVWRFHSSFYVCYAPILHGYTYTLKYEHTDKNNKVDEIEDLMQSEFRY